VTRERLTYLATDSVAEGIGASQVLAYAERIAQRGMQVELHSFEKTTPSADLRARLTAADVDWRPHAFGRYGAAGGLARVMSGAAALRGADLVHARSDMSAASAMLARCPTWLWDVRSLWADQRIALGTLRSGSPEHRVFQRIERAAARRSDAIVTLTHAVLPVLDARFGRVADKATVIPTCVDCNRFTVAAMPPGPPWRVLLAGTLNTYYDVPLMARFMQIGRRRGRAELQLLSPTTTTWDPLLQSIGAIRASARPEEMPERVRDCHVGLSVCRADAGVSLTASMPTKIAEFLATGRPVVVNPGLGDADVLVRRSATGIVLHDRSEAGLEAAWDELEDLLADPETPSRCRRLAQEHFDLDRAVDALVQVYQRISDSHSGSTPGSGSSQAGERL
jgi:glycosyltransferase involved in cell wall biosynthesis